MTQPTLPNHVQCIIIGGVADGVVLPQVSINAQAFELERPTHIKPIASSNQQKPEIATEKDVYEFHPIQLTDSNGKVTVFGIGVVFNMTLPEAFSQLCTAYVKLKTEEYQHEN